MVKIDLLVNGKKHSLEVEEDMRLIDLLREKLGLTGVKEGCSEGECLFLQSASTLLISCLSYIFT